MAIVVAGGLLIFAVAHYALAFALGADAAAIHPRQRPLGLQIYEKLWGRMSAIDHLYHRGQLSPNMRLGVFIGVSTTATGIQRRFLDAEASVADRWIVLSGAGLSFENIENVMQPVFFCSLRPSAVVFGVHPQMLVGERYLGDEPTVDQQRVVGRRRGIESRLGVLRALGWLRKHWAIRNRAIVADYLHTQMYIARLWVFSWARVSADKLVTPVAEPWDEDPFWLWNMDDAENHFAQDQVTFWKKRGHFTPENYDPDGVQARCFVRMIRAYRTLGAEVYVVIMPERSSLRKLVPPNAKPCLYAVLQRAFPDSAPTVIDLEDAMPDPFFTDEAHLSKTGAERLSKLVATHLQAAPASAPAPGGSETPPAPRD